MKRFLRATVSIPAIAWGWMASASAIYCAGMEKMDLYRFPFLQWAEAAPWWHYTPRVGLCVFAGAAIPTVIVLLCGFGMVRHWWRQRGKRLTPPRGGGVRPVQPGVTDNHGSAKVLTDRACLKRFGGPTGVVIGELRSGRAGTAPLVIDPCKSGSGNFMMLAGTRAGKTASGATVLMNWPGSAVVLDPAVEMAHMLRDAMEANGKRVLVLNPEAPIHRFNACDWIDIRRPLAGVAVAELVDWLFPDDGTETKKAADPYFEPTGKSLCLCLLADLLWSDRPAAEKTLKVFRSIVVTPEPLMKHALRSISEHSNSPLAREFASSLRGITPEQWSGVYGEATNGTAWLSHPELADLVSGNCFTTDAIRDGNTIIFAQLPREVLEQSPGIGRVVIGALMKSLYTSRSNHRRVLFFLEEAKSLGRMALIRTALVDGAKAGIQLGFLYQDLGQVKSIWGADGIATLYNNLEWRGYAAIKDKATSEECSEAFGTIGAMAYSSGDNQGTQRQPGAWWGSSSTGSNENTHEISRRLYLPQEIIGAAKGDFFVVAGADKMHLRLPFYFLRPELNNIVKPSPYYLAAAE